VGYHVYLRCAGTIKPQLESGPFRADLTTTVVHSSKLLINDVKPDHSPTPNMFKWTISPTPPRRQRLILIIITLATFDPECRLLNIGNCLRSWNYKLSSSNVESLLLKCIDLLWFKFFKKKKYWTYLFWRSWGQGIFIEFMKEILTFMHYLEKGFVNDNSRWAINTRLTIEFTGIPYCVHFFQSTHCYLYKSLYMNVLIIRFRFSYCVLDIATLRGLKFCSFITCNFSW